MEIPKITEIKIKNKFWYNISDLPCKYSIVKNSEISRLDGISIVSACKLELEIASNEDNSL